MCNEHMYANWKIPIQSRFEISARQSLGATPLQVRAIHIVE